MKLSIHHHSRPIAGEQLNGDAVFLDQAEDQTLFAVVDALGHGKHAAEAAGKAINLLTLQTRGAALTDIMDGLHRALAGSRGAAILLCRLFSFRLEGISVGNIELRAVGAHVPFISTNGIVGHGRLNWKPFAGTLVPKTRLAAFSDGLSARVSLEETRSLSTPTACAALFEAFSRQSDDATLLLADVLEEP